MPFPISKMLGGPRTPATGLPTPLVLQDISEFIARKFARKTFSQLWHLKLESFRIYEVASLQLVKILLHI